MPSPSTAHDETPIEIRVLEPGDQALLAHVADDVFDRAVDRRLARAFLDDPRHHIAVALDQGLIVGIASALDYIHPDKPVQLWINEVGVAPTHRRRGIGRALMRAMLEHGRALGCSEAWVGTERENCSARRLYGSLGAAPEAFVMYAYRLDQDSET